MAQLLRLGGVHVLAQRAPGSPRRGLAPVTSFDQTNILTLLASYKLPRGFQVGARYRYVTGNPYTPVLARTSTSNTDRYVPISGAPFSARLPAFNQLDLRVDKVWTFDRWRYSVYLDVQNIIRATNPEAIELQLRLHRLQNPVSGPAAAADRGRAGRLLMARRSRSWLALLLGRVRRARLTTRRRAP